jgi:hypothetical protein
MNVTDNITDNMDDMDSMEDKLVKGYDFIEQINGAIEWIKYNETIPAEEMAYDLL